MGKAKVRIDTKSLKGTKPPPKTALTPAQIEQMKKQGLQVPEASTTEYTPIPAKYESFDTSPLEVTINSGPNNVPIKLEAQ